MDTATKTWNAFQIAWSNGAYAGKSIVFMDPQNPGHAITGVLRRANTSSETPGNTLLLITGECGDNDWHSVPNHTQVEVTV